MRAAAATADGIEAALTLDSLPPELLGVALAFLRPRDMMPLPECSRQWRDTLDNVYWKPLLLNDFGCAVVEEMLLDNSDQTWQQRYYFHFLFLQNRVRRVLRARRRVGGQGLPCKLLAFHAGVQERRLRNVRRTVLSCF